MSVMLYREKEVEQTTSETTWQDYASYSHQIENEGEYLFWFSTEYSGDLTNRGIAIRATLDGDEVHRENRIPEDAAARYTLSGIKGAHLAAGEHTVKIQYAVEHSSQTIHCYKAHMTVHKH